MEAASLVLGSYQDSLFRAMDVVANNVANMNTSGFKREEVQFDTMVTWSTPKDRLNFVYDRATFRDTGAGVMTTTGNPLDMSIQGSGYFPIMTKTGVKYTRAGSFVLNNEGEIVTPSGDRLLGDSGQPIVVSAGVDDIAISRDGIISGSFGQEKVEIGKLKVAVFANEQKMQNVGNSLYTTTEQPIDSAENAGPIVQGTVERSNVDPVAEMTRMVEVQRAYQQAIHVMEREASRLERAIGQLAKATA